MAHPAHAQFGRCHGDLLGGPGAEKVDPERPVDRKNIEAEKTQHRPGPHQQECKAGGETDHAEKRHQHHKTNSGCGGPGSKSLPAVITCQYIRIMAKITRRPLTKSKPPPPQRGKKSPKRPASSQGREKSANKAATRLGQARPPR